jgi:hypothetical protein
VSSSDVTSYRFPPLVSVILMLTRDIDERTKVELVPQRIIDPGNGTPEPFDCLAFKIGKQETVLIEYC